MVDAPLTDEDLDITTPEDSLPPLSLEDLPEPMREACARASWARLMPVQSHSLPYLLAGRDMMIQSRTGSGKTGAYLLPLLARLNPDEKKPQALILAPTRELAIQVEREAKTLFEGTGLGVTAVYGGVGYGKQLEDLHRGVQVVVGTPGRVLDHLLRRTLSLDSLRVLVFDEADRMLSIGFYPDMKEIQRYLPHRSLLAALFSATYPPHVLKLAGEFLSDPEMLSLSLGQVHVAATQHLCCECRTMDKDRTLVRLLETENPSSAIIFCNTKSNVHYVTGVLQGFGYNADELSADLTQARREDVLNRLRGGAVRLLVATDVAARGIDIPALSHVILYEPPEDREAYIHRAGRTGRAGAVGTVISLVDLMQKMEVERIARFYKIDLVPLAAPTDEDVARIVGQRVIALLEAHKRDCTGLQLERARRFLRLAAELGGGAPHAGQESSRQTKNKGQTESASGADEEQLLLLALLLDSEYQRSLGAVSQPQTVRSAHDSPRESRREAPRARDDRGGSREESGDRGKRRPRRADEATERSGKERNGKQRQGAERRGGKSSVSPVIPSSPVSSPVVPPVSSALAATPIQRPSRPPRAPRPTDGAAKSARPRIFLPAPTDILEDVQENRPADLSAGMHGGTHAAEVVSPVSGDTETAPRKRCKRRPVRQEGASPDVAGDAMPDAGAPSGSSGQDA